jgi:plastocyanin
LAAVACAVGLLAAGCGTDSDEAGPGFSEIENTDAATYEYTIPAGAGLALDDGTPLTILPAELDVTVGETIRIVNEDDRGHNVGPWFVGAGETLRQAFTSEGTFEGSCTVHPSGTFVLHVLDA